MVSKKQKAGVKKGAFYTLDSFIDLSLTEFKIDWNLPLIEILNNFEWFWSDFSMRNQKLVKMVKIDMNILIIMKIKLIIFIKSSFNA